MEHKPLTMAVVASLVVAVSALALAIAIGAAVFIGSHFESQAKQNTQQIIAADQRAALGRSKSLCLALKQMATTPAAQAMHPTFVRVYQSTDCHLVTGTLPPAVLGGH